MNELVDFGSDSEDDQGGDKEKATEQQAPPEQARKRARLSPLHRHYVAPLSFLSEAVEEKDGNFNVANTGLPFGKNKEAYARKCYEDIVQEIFESRENFRKETKPVKTAMLFVVGGSSGVGKSTFLAYFIVRMRKRFKNIAVCYAPKTAKTAYGTPNTNEVICVVWKERTKIVEGTYSGVRDQLVGELPNLDLIVMDGCSMPFVDVEKFSGTVLVAASPSLYVKNLKDAIFYHCNFIMPPLEESEAISIAKLLGIADEVVQDNFKLMRGITRYLFKRDAAKTQIESVVVEVSASSITKMVSMQSSSRAEQLVAVHSLVLWKMGKTYKDIPSFELVSRYAEQLVAKKLAKEASEDLKIARRNMAPLSGAEGYAGALFEAYAIRILQAGGKFEMRSLDSANTKNTIELSPMTTDPVVVESNTLDVDVVPYNIVRVPVGGSSNGYFPRLLWPTTTNFPTFDCFYFQIDGTVFPFQMTIAKTYDLKNSGAASTKMYLDGMFGQQENEGTKPKKYPAVFVVPQDNCAGYQKQKFTGNVNKKAMDYGPYFEQWVIGV